MSTEYKILTEMINIKYVRKVKNKHIKCLFFHIFCISAYNSLEEIFMKDSALILSESHVPASKVDYKIICRTVNTWLTKKLQKCGN